jgi:catechol 2,3-dioxygenase-like lactoylglutathione lyase family enzyme
MRFNKLIPELSVSNLAKSLDFYTKILGFRLEYARQESKFAFLSFEGSQLMIQQTNSTWETGKLEHPYGMGINLQIEVKEIAQLLSSLKANKYPIMVPPKDSWYRQGTLLLGNREFLVQDPDGYLLRFAQDLGTKKVPKG